MLWCSLNFVRSLSTSQSLQEGEILYFGGVSQERKEPEEWQPSIHDGDGSGQNIPVPASAMW